MGVDRLQGSWKTILASRWWLRPEMPTLATRSVSFAQSPGFLAGLVFVGLGMVLLRKLRSW